MVRRLNERLGRYGYDVELVDVVTGNQEIDGDAENIHKIIWDECLSDAIEADAAETGPKIGDLRRTMGVAAQVYTTKYYYVAEQIYTPYKDTRKAGGYWKHNGYIVGLPGIGVSHKSALEYCNE